MAATTNNKTTRTRKQATKPVRTVKLCCWIDELNAGIIAITTDGVTVHYHIKQITSDYGLAFRIEKHTSDLDGEIYDVLLDEQNVGSTCDCKGHTYHGHCKHVDAIKALVARGKICF